MQQLDHKQAGQPPGNGEAQADIATQVKGLLGVVPPALVKQPLQHKAGQPLQQGGQGHRPKEEQQQVPPQRFQHPQYNDHTEAVDRTDRPVEKAPVDEPPGLEGGITHFRTPPQKGVDKKDPKQMIHGASPPRRTHPEPFNSS